MKVNQKDKIIKKKELNKNKKIILLFNMKIIQNMKNRIHFIYFLIKIKKIREIKIIN